eukprot:1504296-Rhodomonas_salina.1
MLLIAGCRGSDRPCGSEAGAVVERCETETRNRMRGTMLWTDIVGPASRDFTVAVWGVPGVGWWY